MGNKSNATAAPTSPSTTNTSIPTTKTTTPITHSAASTTTAAPTTTVPTTTTTTTTAATATTPTPTITSTAPATKDTSTISASTVGTSKPKFFSLVKSVTSNADTKDTSTTSVSTAGTSKPKFFSLVKSATSDAGTKDTPTTSVSTASTSKPKFFSLVKSATSNAGTKDTPTISVSTASTPNTKFYSVVKSVTTDADNKDTSTTSVSAAGISKPTFYSVVKSATADTDKAKAASSAYAQWYKWSKFEQQKRDKGKILWYMSPPATTSDILSPTTTTLTMTTARIGDDQKETSDPSNITAIPSFQLRSTAVYSPPHGDRVPSGRSELINTDTSIFKYYLPENRSQQTVGIHTKATMYKMNTHSKQTPLPTKSFPITTNTDTNVAGNNPPLPTFVSRGLQTDFEVQPMNSSSTQMRYYEKQQPQIVPISAFSNYNSSDNAFFHLPSQGTINQPVLPPIEKTPVWFNDQPYPSVTQSFPSYPPPPQPPPPPSILKNSSTVLSQDTYNPLSEQTHDKVLEELRRRNKNTKDGTYRVKKVHLLEKDHPEYYQPPTVSFNLPPPPPTKASQSIMRSEKLFF